MINKPEIKKSIKLATKLIKGQGRILSKEIWNRVKNKNNGEKVIIEFFSKNV